MHLKSLSPTTKTYAEAVRLTEAGISVLAVKSDGSKSPASDVMPLDEKRKASWKVFQERLPNLSELRKMFANGHGIARVHGKISGNLETLDFDLPGLCERYETVCNQHGLGDLLRTLPLIKTMSNGRHLVYRCETPIGGNQKLAETADRKTLIETRGEGGYAVMPPTPGYELLRGDLANPPTLTEQQRNALLDVARSPTERVPPEKTIGEQAKPKKDGELRPGDDYNERGDYESLLEEHGWKRVGQGGEKIYWQRPDKDGNGCSATTGFRGARLLYVFSTNGEPFETDKWYTPFAVYTLLEHGNDFSKAAGDLAKQGYGKTTDAKSFNRTDLGNAERFAAQHDKTLRFVPELGKWLLWKGTKWRWDEVGEIYGLAKQTVRSIYEEALGNDDSDKRSKLMAWAIGSESKGKLEAMLSLAQKEKDIPILVEELDRDSLLLGCQNGVVDLRTGLCRPMKQTDYITKYANVVYDAKAKAPTWEATLAKLQPDPLMRKYLQAAFGYALTGLIDEQCFFFFYGVGTKRDGSAGNGRNGKSTILETLLWLFGDYGLKTTIETFLQSKQSGTGPRPEVLQLRGCRLVVGSEVPISTQMDTAFIKDITGKDKISARTHYKEPVQFAPTCKVFLYGNYKPAIKGSDEGTWRRPRLIEFPTYIEDDEVDKKLTEKLQAECAGILNWLIAGALLWQKEGLQQPDSIRKAVQDYREEMDTLGQFIAECCVVQPDAEVSNKELYGEYQDWCKQTGTYSQSSHYFSPRMKERGMRQRTLKGRAIWIGLRLRTPADDLNDKMADTKTKTWGQKHEELMGGISNQQDYPHTTKIRVKSHARR